MYMTDSFGMNKHEFESLFKQFEDAKEWLESNGIRVSPTRFQKCLKLLDCDKSNDLDILWANTELHDLLEIYTNLNQIESSNLLKTLKKMIGGHHLLSEEKTDGKSVQGRNFTFELYTASRLARAGFDVTFDTDADVNFQIAGSMVHVECKRVNSPDNMHNLIDQAFKQVERRCQIPDDSGLVAISMSKLVSIALEQESIDKGTYADFEELQQYMRVLVGKWGQLLHHHYSNKSKKCFGMILHYKMPFRDRKTGAVAFLNRFSLIGFRSTPENENRVNYLSSKLSNSIQSNIGNS